VRVHFLGVRGSTPAPGEAFVRYGGHTSCVALAHGDGPPTLLLDAGVGIRRASALWARRPFEGTIALSHLHWDHVHGLPFFRAADHDESRVDVLLPVQDDGDALEVLARGMSPPHFPVRPDELRGTWSFSTLTDPVEVEGFTLRVAEIPHKGGRTLGLRVSDGASSVAYLPDHCPTALGPGPDGLGERHASALELCEGADLLIHDAQLVASEVPAQAHFGHACVEYGIDLARAAGAARVVPFHHGPDRDDDALDAIAARVASPDVLFAHEALVLDL
jgi:phosphoribosyl 1,2-cyclic phosphodiesterase